MTTTTQGSTNWSEQQQQQHHQSERANGKSSDTATSATNTYPPPTALYEELARDANLFREKLESFHKSFGTKFNVFWYALREKLPVIVKFKRCASGKLLLCQIDHDNEVEDGVPTIGGKPLDLYRLFMEVTSRGGLEKVIVERKWKDVIVGFKFRETITSASFMVRRYYLSLLYHFEQVYYFRKQVPPSSPHDPANRSLVNSSTTIGEASPVQQLGSVVPGTIDGKFDGGYVVTVNLGSEQVKGILYHVPINVAQSSKTVGVPSSRNRKRSRLALRDPSRPKSNRSGYNFFFAENYARLKPSFHGQERAISKRIGFLWSNLTEAERQVYQEKGLRDKERYRTEMLEYKSNNSTPQ